MIRRTLHSVIYVGMFLILAGTLATVRAESPNRHPGVAGTTSQEAGISPQILLASGLQGLETWSDESGSQVRGLARGGAGRASGMSFVAGMLYDPGTSSTLRGSNSNHSAAYGGGARSEVAQISAIMLGMTIRIDGVTTFNGSITGTAGGSGFAQP